MSLRLASLTLALAMILSACSGSEQPSPAGSPSPALWEIKGPDGTVEGWLFGTIHALPDGVTWRSATLEDRLRKADMLVVEVAGLEDDSDLSRQFQTMAFDDPGGPLRERIPAEHRSQYDRLLSDAGVAATRFDPMESWAAALALGQLSQKADVENGVDRALLHDFRKREVVELEGGAKQLGIFDSLPEKEQRDLLGAVLDEAAASDQQMDKLTDAWRAGDTDALVRLTSKGILADPELRKTLLVDRNRAWAEQVENLLSTPQRPFVAVGTGHLIGPDGLPQLLTQQGYTVTRIQ